MNKEYTISDTSNRAVYQRICSFFSDCGYTIQFTYNNMSIYRDATFKFYIIVYTEDDDNVYFAFSREWDVNLSWYAQTESIKADKLGSDTYIVYALPCTLGTLVGNYFDGTFMFSMIDDTTIARRTYFVFFGQLNNIFSEFTDHLFVGGTQCRSIHNDKITVIQKYEYTHTIYMALYISVDNSPAQSRGHVMWATDHEFTSLNLVTSLANEYNTNSLPVYTAMLNTYAGKRNILVPGANYTQLNGITLCLPIICYILRDPHVLDTYSVVGSTDILTYVDMYNIHSGRFMDSDFPVQKQNYQCFSVYIRRNPGINDTTSTDMHRGFAGVAFKQEMEEEEDS